MSPPDVGQRSKRSTAGEETTVAGVRLTSPERVLYEDQGVTKRRLAEYYREVGGILLEYAARRPLTLVRCPRGRGEKCFYQKHVGASIPEDIPDVEIEESGGTGSYLYLSAVTDLVGLVQVGTLEIHPWGSRIDRLDRPDRLIFDLDPGEGTGWSAVVASAADLRERLESLGLRSFLMTTGGKGLHVVAPLTRRRGWDDVKAFARGLAYRMAREEPERFVARASKAERKGRIYVDYLRNGRGATAVAPYSTRARPGAPVAVPLRWDELSTSLRSDHWNVKTLPRRLKGLKRDPWQEYGETDQSVTANMLRAVDAD